MYARDIGVSLLGLASLAGLWKTLTYDLGLALLVVA